MLSKLNHSESRALILFQTMAFSQENKKSVLFVCLGNICRSPACEGVCRKMFGDKVRVDSCGTAGYHVGQHPDTRSTKACRNHGVDISTHVARQINKSDYQKFDVIAALDDSVFSDVKSMKPSNCKASIVLFDPPNGVDDPYYGGSEGFNSMYNQIERVMPEFLRQNNLIQ